jgi:hypothetical protein
MSNKFRKFRDFEYDEEYNDDRYQRADLNEHRKMKRLRNALKAKNIDDLLDDDN